MATVSQPSYYNLQALTDLGALGVGMRLYTYAAGTTTHKTAYTSSTGSTPHTYSTDDGGVTQYIALDARGELPAPLYLATGSYDIALKTSTGATVWTRRADSLADTQAAYTPPQAGATATTLQAIAAINFNPGNPTAVAGGAMQIDALMEAGTPTFPLKNEGGIWADKVHTFAGISKEFTAATGAGAFDASPSTALFAYAVNNGHLGAVCALIGDAVGNTTGCSVFGGNFIARNASGINGVKMVGLEIDVEFATGTTAGAGSGGLFINVFSAAVAGAAIQVGGIASGTFANGIALTGGLASTASGLFSNGLSIGSLVNTGTSTYADGAIVVSNTHRVVFSGTGLLPASIYNDASNNLRITGGATATVIRNQADTVSLLSIANGGLVSLSSTGTINWDSAQTGTTVGAAGPASALPATPQGYISIQISGVARRVPFYA